MLALLHLMTVLLLTSLTYACGAPAHGGTPVLAAPRTNAGPERPIGSIQAVTGEVVDVENLPLNNQTYVKLSLKLSGEGPPLSVRLGPGWYLDERGLRFNPREQVTVHGRHQWVDGRDIFVATEVTKDGSTHPLPAEDTEPEQK